MRPSPPRLAAAALAGLLALAPAGALAQGLSDPDGKPSLREQLDEALRGMIDEMKPALDELLDTFQFLDEIDGLENYERPEILPNGDIIIRRRPDAPPWPPEDAPEDDDAGPGIKT